MGIYYTHYVVPSAADWNYSPNTEAVLAILDLLAKQDWIDADAETFATIVPLATGKRRRSRHKNLEALKEEVVSKDGGDENALGLGLRCFPATHFYGEDWLDVDGLSLRYEFSHDGTMRPRFAYSVQLILCRFLAVGPLADLNGNHQIVPCPACEVDLSRDARALWPRGVADYMDIDAGIARMCECGHVTQPGELFGWDRNAQTGERVRTRSPFYRCALQIEPAPKATPDRSIAKTDPALLRGLAAATGIKWREFGDWS